MDPRTKAKELIVAHGKEVANKIVDALLTEVQTSWNQKRIDFYLDVKNEINGVGKIKEPTTNSQQPTTKC